jgi:hypothetical protein
MTSTSESKCKAFPRQAWTGPLVFQEAEAAQFLDNRHMMVLRLSASCTSRLYLQEQISWESKKVTENASDIYIYKCGLELRYFTVIFVTLYLYNTF